MIKYEKIVKYNDLMDKRIELSDEIERISHTLLSVDSEEQIQNELLYELEYKTKEYESLIDTLRNFKFE